LRLLGDRVYDAILSDLKMPGLDGPRLYGHLAANAPELVGRLGFVTGDAMSPTARSFLKTADRPYVEKPATPDDLRDLLARLAQAC
jgi:CheY-like chemotaxis protein